MDSNTRRANLARLIARRFNGSHQGAAQEMGVSPGRVSQLLDANQPFGERAARKIEDRLRLSHHFLDALGAAESSLPSATSPVAHAALSPAGPAFGYVRLPILAQAAAGAGRVATGEVGELVDHVDVAEEWVRRTLRANPTTLRVLTAKGHSMAGVVEDGDVMFVEPCTEFGPDGVYVIGIDDLLRVKRLRLRVMDRLLSIESTDGSAPEIASLHDVGTRLRIHGRVVATWTLRKEL